MPVLDLDDPSLTNKQTNKLHDHHKTLALGYPTPHTLTSKLQTKTPPTMTGNGNTAGDQLGGAAKFVTSTLGNTVGGVGKTVGNVTGAASRGVGDTLTSATGETGRPVGDALGNIGSGVEGGLNNVGQGVENAGQWKKQ